ncbi:hypothetical protein BD779DRAFT_1667914 [Infundibulicybe gibba]|nr:hypothetical protein BD779DRAFT_1667914 [Infundibulicybe gibba]
MKKPSAAAAHVVGSAIVVFLPGDVTSQDQEDVCNSFEFSQRATRRQSPEPEHIKEWEEALFNSLSRLHWFFQSSDIPEKHVELADLLKEIKLSDTERRLVENAFDALISKSENSDALKLFNDRVAIGGSPQPSDTDQHAAGQRTLTGEGGQTQGRYQIVVCSVKNGAIAAKFISCQFVGSTFLSDVLFPQFHRSTKIRISASTRGFNLDTYAPNREKVKKNLEAAGPSTQSKIVLPSSK